jgi:3-hydroxyacyl-CoA dehydrogenase/enoyl-CoA hydratase/3-hydroxybutyryl-CoA epimerase
MQPASGLQTMADPERLGRKTKRGFYDYTNPKKPSLCTDLAQFQTGQSARRFNDSDIVDRLVLSMVNESTRCLQEEVVAGPVEMDLATVFGTGFAPFEGGLYSYAQRRGADVIRDRLKAIADAPDIAERPGGVAKFTPA